MSSSLRVRLGSSTISVDFDAPVNAVSLRQCHDAVVSALKLSVDDTTQLRLTRPFPPPSLVVLQSSDLLDDALASTTTLASRQVQSRDSLVAELINDAKPRPRIRASAGTKAATVETQVVPSPGALPKPRRKRLRVSELGRGRRLDEEADDNDDDADPETDTPQDRLGAMLVEAAGETDGWSAGDRALLSDLRVDLRKARAAFHLELLSDSRVASALAGNYTFSETVDGKTDVAFGQKQRRQREPQAESVNEDGVAVVDVEAERELVFVHEHCDEGVPLVPSFLLKMVLLQVAQSDGIQAISPHSMASKSLRCFWSVVKSQQIGPGMPFSTAMLQLLPQAFVADHIDAISKFDTRTRTLSEKARRNKEQQEEEQHGAILKN
jgi:hypothetical protein